MKKLMSDVTDARYNAKFCNSLGLTTNLWEWYNYYILCIYLN